MIKDHNVDISTHDIDNTITNIKIIIITIMTTLVCAS